MKKMFALLLALSLTLTALCLPAWAEEASTTTTQITAKGRQQNGQMPGNGQQPQGQMPGNRQQPQGQMPENGQQPQGQMPENGQQPQGQMPENGQQPQGQMPENGQQPQGQMPENGQQPQDQMPENGQQPQDQMPGNNQKPANGKIQQKPGRGGRQFVSFDDLLKNGVITQETYDKIMDYMRQHTPQEEAPADTTAPDAEPAEGTEPPALPEGGVTGDMEENDLLKDLLSEGILTQSEYDTISAMSQSDLTAEAPSTTSSNQ